MMSDEVVTLSHLNICEGITSFISRDLKLEMAIIEASKLVKSLTNGYKIDYIMLEDDINKGHKVFIDEEHINLIWIHDKNAIYGPDLFIGVLDIECFKLRPDQCSVVYCERMTGYDFDYDAKYDDKFHEYCINHICTYYNCENRAVYFYEKHGDEYQMCVKHIKISNIRLMC